MIALTSLIRIRERRPCIDGWKRLLAHLQKTCADNEPLEAETILDACGIAAAIWSLRAMSNVTEQDKATFVLWCVQQTTPVLTSTASFALLECLNAVVRSDDAELSENAADELSELLTKGQEAAQAAVSRLLLQPDVRMSAVLAAQAVVHLVATEEEQARSLCLATDLAAMAIAYEPMNVMNPETFEKARIAQAGKFYEMFCTKSEPASLEDKPSIG